MIAIVGESGSGKSSAVAKLIDNYGCKKLVTYTTRSPRSGEFDGVDYHFVTCEKYDEMVNNNQFAENASYNGWKYGIAREDCTNDSVVIVTPKGLRALKKDRSLHISSFYINVPRRDRLIKILQRGDDIEEAYRRSLSDVGQFDGIEDEVDFVIDNAGYTKSVDEIAREITYLLSGGSVPWI